MQKILFVCTGNICRSPTAEAVFRKLVDKAGLGDHFELDSCGTHAYHVGEGADPRSSRFAKERGYDLSKHIARKITLADFEHYDWILVMDKTHLRELEAIAPVGLRHKIELFMRFSTHSEQTIIPDPYYGGDAGFVKVIDYCEDAAQGFLAYLKKAHRL